MQRCCRITCIRLWPRNLRVLELCWDDASVLYSIALSIVRGDGERDLELAHRTAERASELEDHEDASKLNMLALVCHEMGELEKAIEWQKKAVEQDARYGLILRRYEAELPAETDSDEAAAEEGELSPEENEPGAEETDATSDSP